MPGARLWIAGSSVVLVWIAEQNCVKSGGQLSLGR